MTEPTKVRYRTEHGTTILEFHRDPFEVLEAVRSRMFPGVERLAVDEKFERVMRERKC